MSLFQHFTIVKELLCNILQVLQLWSLNTSSLRKVRILTHNGAVVPICLPACFISETTGRISITFIIEGPTLKICRVNIVASCRYSGLAGCAITSPGGPWVCVPVVSGPLSKWTGRLENFLEQSRPSPAVPVVQRRVAVEKSRYWVGVTGTVCVIYGVCADWQVVLWEWAMPKLCSASVKRERSRLLFRK